MIRAAVWLAALLYSALALAQDSHPTIGPDAPYPVQMPCINGATVTAPGDTAENIMFTCAQAANAIGANGHVRVSFQYSGAGGGTKTLRVRYGGVGGTDWGSFTFTTQGRATVIWMVTNNNSASAQQITIGNANIAAAAQVSNTTAAADTSIAGDIVVTCTKALAGDSCILNGATLERIYKP